MSSKIAGASSRKIKNDPPRDEPTPLTDTNEPAHAIPVELIAELAYQKYLARGESHGSDVQDWLDAEREIAVSHKSSPN